MKDLIERSGSFALAVLRFSKGMKKSFENEVLLKQLIRSSTSLAANYRSSQNARSKAEFYSKMCIVVEECDEAIFWLELLKEINPNKSPAINQLIEEAGNLVRIFASIKFKIKRQLNK